MPAISSLTSIAVTGRYLTVAGNPAVGTVEFVLSATGQVPSSNIMVPQVTVTAALDDTGALTVSLPATDDPDWATGGLLYQVTERIAGTKTRTYHIAVPAGSPGATADLADLAPAVAGPALVTYVLAAAVGQPSGVASLDVTGNVPLAQLGNAPTGSGTPSGAVVAETSYGQSAAAGSSTTYSRGDHTHGSPSLTSTSPAAETIGASAAVGVASTPARADHVHAMPAAATAGASAVGDSPAAGSAATVARSDHVHGREGFGTVTAQTSYGAATGNGSAATVAHSDHTHGTPALTGVAPTSSAVGDSAAVGTATTPSRADHVHGRETFGAVTAQTTFGGASANGVAATVARSDHAHGTPAAPGDNTSTQRVVVSKAGVLVGTRQQVNLIEGTNVTLTVADNPGADRVDVTVTAAGGGGAALHIANTGLITGGDITVTSGGFVQIGSDLTVTAVAGDVLQLDAELLSNSSGPDYQFEAATRVTGADNRYWSSGTGTSRYPGTLGCWYVESGSFTGPRPARYVVAADDVVAGSVTVRFYAQIGSSSRTVFANSNYPLRLWLTNLGAG